MLRTSQIQSLSDPIWNKGDSSFSAKVGYPFPEILRSPDDCVAAIDWITQHVLDLYDDPMVSLAQWYDFIWAHFWSIRKRLVQFNLDDLESVGIIERCARFHIYCAHAFAEIPEPLFVAKFNFEHIGKCLITLKYLYHDLNSRDINCSNEAEFLCYYLIHFPKSYRDLLEFSPVIRRSKPIQFALKFLETLNTNNFVAFFNLVKKATYLQACLLHRYFLPMRERAISVMCRSYNRTPTTIFNVSVNHLMSLLAFEDTTELESYLRYAGIDYDFENVSFMQSCFVGAGPKPEIRSSEVAIGCKRQRRSIQDIITGGEGPLLSSDQPIYPLPGAINLDGNESEYGEKLRKQVRIAEAICKSIYLRTISDLVVETFTRLRYPDGQPVIVYDDSSLIDSTVSELDDTRNVSDGEVTFEENFDQVEEKKVENEQKLDKSISVTSLLVEPVLPEPEPYVEPEPEKEPERKPEPERQSVKTPSKLTPPELMAPSSTPEESSQLMARTRLRSVRARAIMRARFPVKSPDPQPVSKLTPETEAKSTSQSNPSESEIESEPGPSEPSKSAICENEQEPSVDQDLNDSNLVISDDNSDEPIEPTDTEKMNPKVPKVTITSILRAIERYNKEHGKRL